jgi:PKD repeat protein
VSDLEYLTSANRPFRLYAAVGDSNGNPQNGIYEGVLQANGSFVWEKIIVSNHFPANGSALGRIVMASDHDDILYVAVARPYRARVNNVLKAVYRARDAASIWTNTRALPNYIEDQAWFNLAIGLSPRRPDNTRRVYLAGQHRVFEAADAVGQALNWQAIADDRAVPGSPHVDHHSFAFSADGTRVYDGNDGGAWEYNTQAPAGRRWSDLNTSGLQSHQVQGVGVNQINHDQLLEGSNDNGVAITVVGGQPWNGVVGGDGGLVRFGLDGTAYAILAFGSNPNGRLQRSPNGRDRWSNITPIVPGGYPSYPVIATNPRAAGLLLFGGTGKVWQSRTGGSAVGPAGPALAWENISPPAGAGTAFPLADVTALTYAPLPGGIWDRVVYAGFANGQVFRTDHANGGAPRPWVNVTDSAPRAPRWGASIVRSIAPDPSRPGEVYLALQVYGRPQVWFSNDSGGTWNQITRYRVLGPLLPAGLLFIPLPVPGGLPNVPVRALVVDPRPGARAVYAGTEVGVYRGIQGAQGAWSWQRFGNNLPNVAVKDLQFDGTLLIAGTDGRGVWRIDTGGAPAGAVEGRPATQVGLGTFTDPAGHTTQVVQSIDWADGSPLDTSTGSISWAGTTATVTGSHTFAEAGSYTVTATITKNDGSPPLLLTSTITVGDAALAATGTGVSASVNTAVSGVQVATFTDANPLGLATDFTAVIFWGDGAVSFGAVTGSGGNFTVTGGHTYTSAGSFPVQVTVTETNGLGYALASSIAAVSGALSLQPGSLSPTEASPTGSVTVATFTDTFPAPQPSDYTATVSWGDGHITTGAVAAQPGGAFKITASNTYAQAGDFLVTVSLQNIRGASASVSFPVAVGDAPLTGMGLVLTATQGAPLNNVVVARFSDADPQAPLGAYAAAIDWGDTQPTAQEGPPVQDPDTVGTVVAETANTFAVLGNHTYAQSGTYTVTVTVTDAGGGSAVLTSTVTVAGAAPAVTGLNPPSGRPLAARSSPSRAPPWPGPPRSPSAPPPPQPSSSTPTARSPPRPRRRPPVPSMCG